MNNLVLFYSTNHAIWADETLKDAGVKSSMISVPRELSSDCGYCVKFEGEIKKVEDLLNSNGIEFDKILEM